MLLPVMHDAIGIDEVGIGAVAGPIVAAGVLIPQGFDCDGIRDSKKLSAVSLEYHAKRILKECNYYIHAAGVPFINSVGVWKAWEALVNEICFVMRARHGVTKHIILDGNRIPPGCYRLKSVVKGDSTWANIAAASIIAKSYRRALMKRLGAGYTAYDLLRNEGYGTPKHIKALLKHGPTEIHRVAGTTTLINNARSKNAHS